MSPFHEDATAAVRAAVRAALATSYGAQVAKSGIVWTYACREIRGGSSHSEHAHPIAVDVNPPQNPLRDDGVLICDFTRFSLADGVEFVNAFKRAGFVWGGDWNKDPRTTRATLERRRKIDGRRDPMHFQYAGPPVEEVRRRRYVLRWRTASGERGRRVFLSLARMLRFLRRKHRLFERAQRVAWEQKVTLEVTPK